MRGYCGIGIFQCKNTLNYGSLFRTAQVLDVNFLFMIGQRFKRQSSDTMKSWKHIPLFEYKDFESFYENLPFDCQLIGVELIDKAKNLNEFSHPERACYLLGAEDNGIPEKVLDKCHSVVKLHGKRSMNVAVAGSIVLHDRLNKLRD